MTGVNRPRICVVVNRFPTFSESFIVRKAESLLARGFDITVLRHDRNEQDRSIPVADGLRIIGSLGTGPMLVPRLVTTTLRHPSRALATLAAAFRRYGFGSRAIKAWLLALPAAVTGCDIVHFEFSGIAVAYADALPLLWPAKLVVSCRGASEQIDPVVRPARRD